MAEPIEQTYVIRNPQNECQACDWRWPDSRSAAWTMSTLEGKWMCDGPLTEVGRAVLLIHFGLTEVHGELPLNVIRSMSPAQLAHKRRALERERRLPALAMASMRMGDHVQADLAA